MATQFDVKDNYFVPEQNRGASRFLKYFVFDLAKETLKAY